MYDRNAVTCHLCFADRVLQDWIKQKSTLSGVCPWCGRRGRLIGLEDLGEPFREVVSIYDPVDGSDTYEQGDLIGFLLDDGWNVFSEEIQTNDLSQSLAVAILEAGLSGKDLYDYPDYSGLFRHREYSLEDTWDRRARRVLGEDFSPNADTTSIESEMGEDFPDQLRVAFEDLATDYEQGVVLYRARVHADRHRHDRFSVHEVGAPPSEVALAGRANRQGQRVLYLATNKSTALAEVRPWKGAAVAVATATLARRLSLVDLTRARPLASPFFVELLEWKLELNGLLFRLAQDMSSPVQPNEQDILYRPTQLLVQMIESSGYAGCIYPSAAGPGKNIVLFDPNDAEISEPKYLRVKQVSYFTDALSQFEEVYEEGPYDFALPRR
ncbi:MAG: RES family NAD+ phosphorylase [Pseudomonadota bacterium]